MIYVVYDLHLRISGEWIGHEAGIDFSGSKYKDLLTQELNIDQS